jgi:hypothetical protein
MQEKATRSVPTEVLFVHVTTNVALDMYNVISDNKLMSVAQREYDQVRKKLLSKFSFISTVLECTTRYSQEWEKQIVASASMLAVEAYAMSMNDQLNETGEFSNKSNDIEEILDWTNLQYKSGAYRRTSKGYKWRVALMFLLMNEVSESASKKKALK